MRSAAINQMKLVITAYFLFFTFGCAAASKYPPISPNQTAGIITAAIRLTERERSGTKNYAIQILEALQKNLHYDPDSKTLTFQMVFDDLPQIPWSLPIADGILIGNILTDNLVPYDVNLSGEEKEVSAFYVGYLVEVISLTLKKLKRE